MKKIISFLIVYLIAACLFIVACTAQKKTQPDFPDAMLPHVKEAYAKRFEQGRLLYSMACARCHTTKKGKKEIVPDFKPEQLTGYALRVSNAQHETNMPDSLVTEEELAIIMTFLNYKKKNPVTASSKK
jgi:hypothetical protein